MQVGYEGQRLAPPYRQIDHRRRPRQIWKKYDNTQIVSLSDEAIRSQLQRILKDRRFESAQSISRFLKFTIEEVLQGRGSSLKEYLIGVDVFDRGDQFDSRIDPIVRVQAGKLRAKLREYYEGEGNHDPVVIEFPKGAYVPVFRERGPQETVVPTAQAKIPERSRRWIYYTAGLVFVAAATGTWWTRKDQPAPPPQVTLSRLTADSGHTTHPTVSRDGSWLAYASDRGGTGDSNIWVQPLRGGEPVQLTHHVATESHPDFSPDGTLVVYRSFRSGGGIYVVKTVGGEERLIAERGYVPRFSPDGHWVAYSGSSGILVVPSAGGPSQRLDTGLDSWNCPIWTPDGKELLFLADQNDGKYDWWLAPFVPSNGASAKPLKTGVSDALIRAGFQLNDDTCPSDWIGDQIIFTLKVGGMGNLWTIPIAGGHPTGPARQIVPGPGVDFARAWLQPDQPTRVVFSTERRTSHLWSLELGGTEPRLAQLTFDASLTHGIEGTRPSLSADGTRLVFASSRTGNLDIWLKDLRNGKEHALTTNLRPEDSPRISPDGRLVVYRALDGERQSIYVVDTDKPAPKKLCDDCGTPKDWLLDDAHVLCSSDRHSSLYVLDTRNGARSEFFKHPTYSIKEVASSSDGQWVAAVVKKFGDERERGVVIPVDGFKAANPERWVPIVDEPFHQALAWSDAGDRIYFLSVKDDFRCLWSQDLDAVTKEPKGNPIVVHHFHSVQRYPWSGSWISVAKDKVVLNLSDTTANIWMATLSGVYGKR